MTTYLPPTEDLPNFNPSVFQNGSTEGITLSDADTRYVKKSGSIMTGSLSTPSLLVNSIDVETKLSQIEELVTNNTSAINDKQDEITASNRLSATLIGANGDVTNTEYGYLNGVTSNIQDQLTFNAQATTQNTNKISPLQTKTTDITFAGLTTTIANNLNIDGILSTPSIINLQSDILANNAKVGITTAQANEITANTSNVATLQTKTTDITFAGSTTTIANNLDIDGILSTPGITNLQSDILANNDKVGITTAQANEITANTAKIATLGAAYISWDNNSVSNSIWGNNNRLDTLTTTAKKIGTITASENTTRSGAVDFGSGTYRIKVNATVTPRQSGSITITPSRIDFRLYISVNDLNITTFTDGDIGAYGSGYIRNLNAHDQGYGTNICFESLQYFGTTTEVSIKTQIYDNTTATAGTSYAGQLPENNIYVWCHMVVEKIATTDITTELAW
jgi:hypothetical protein